MNTTFGQDMSLYGLLGFVLFGFLWALYFQYVDGYVRKWKLERKINTNDLILLQEIIRLEQNPNLEVPKRIESLIGRISDLSLKQTATMLRKQQAEIANLKAGLLSHHDIYPVKELTDEEIISTMVQFDVYSSDDHCLIEAGRAILRKAQEK